MMDLRTGPVSLTGTPLSSKLNFDSGWVPRPLEEIPAPWICRLLSASLSDSGVTRKTLDFWRWKHGDNPFGQSIGLAAMAPDGSLVGLRPFMAWQLSYGPGDVIRAARPVDTATAAEWRGKGVFTNLTQAALAHLERRGVSLIFNTPNANSLPGYLKLGWRVVARLPVAIRVLRPWRFLAGLAQPGDRRVALPDWSTVSQGATQSWRQSTATGAVLALAALSEADRGFHGLRTPRTAAFLEWRYGQHPQADYGLFPLWGRAGGLEGAAVLRLERRRGLLGGLITDLFVAPGNHQTGIRLLRGLCRDLRVDYLLAHAAPGVPEWAMLRGARFLPVPFQGINLVARELSQPDALPVDPHQPTSWDLTLCELEMF